MLLQLLQCTVDQLTFLGTFFPQGSLFSESTWRTLGHSALAPIIVTATFTTTNRPGHILYPFGLTV